MRDSGCVSIGPNFSKSTFGHGSRSSAPRLAPDAAPDAAAAGAAVGAFAYFGKRKHEKDGLPTDPLTELFVNDDDTI